MTRPTARQMWQVLEPIHAVVYFSPEPLAALKQAGYRGFWMGYFAQRAAPFGAAPAPLVEATFYNFSTDRVHRALPSAWEYAPPSAALEARVSGSVAALTRIGSADRRVLDAACDAADLALTAALGASLAGLPLYAANRSIPVPAEPLARLWHAATLLREHRGDGHVATLLTSGIGGRESHVLHSLATGIAPTTYMTSRDFTPEEWAACAASLERRGLADASGLTDAGHALKDEIESRTDELAEHAYAHLDDQDLSALYAAVRALALAVAASGDVPMQTPIGIDLSAI